MTTHGIFNNNFVPDRFKIKYVRKSNGGKHTALNYSHRFISGNIVAIVDSDDVITEDAIEVVINFWNKYFKDKSISGVTFQKGNLEGKKLDESISSIKKCTYFEAVKAGLKGDHFETVRAEEICKYFFPEYEGEKFCGELPMWLSIFQDRDVVYVDRVLYLCEYLEDGLTKSGRKLRVSCPRGGKYHASVLMDKRFNLKVRLKNAMLYVCYSKMLKESFSQILKNNHNRFLLCCVYLEGLLLCKIWKRKYLGDD